MPPDQQNNETYSQYGVFWLYNWFQVDNDNMNMFFLMNGNIFGSSLASISYKFGQCGFNKCEAKAIPPNPPTSKYYGEPIFVKSYINTYETAFNQSVNKQVALNNYVRFTSSDVNSNFVPGTFGYHEEYTGSISNSQSNIVMDKLKDDFKVYVGTPYLFVSTGSGGGSGFMYLDWVIVTYGVPYVVSVS